jgi:deoxycytidylate deaminase
MVSCISLTGMLARNSKERRILTTGFNGAPAGIDSCRTGESA